MCMVENMLSTGGHHASEKDDGGNLVLTENILAFHDVCGSVGNKTESDSCHRLCERFAGRAEIRTLGKIQKPATIRLQ